MSSDPPSALSSGVASRFVSSTALEEAKAKRQQEWKEAYERIGQEPPKEMREEQDAPYDGRSLYEKLKAQKDAKQEAFEEQLKFKNQFRALDEDEIDFLDTMIEESNEEEKERQRQIKEELQGFKAAVLKRGSGPAPAVSPPVASTSAAASSSSTALAPKTSAPAPKKGKKKLLAGVVVKKKQPAAAAAAKSASPAAAAASPPAAAAGTKRTASEVDAASPALVEATKGAPPAAKSDGDEGERPDEKKRKTDE
ncbi:hypothetical protein JCM8547_008084 [Rhodosporidiobolus lusitaniae]